MGRTAKLDYEASSPQARAMLDAYAAGVNAFLATTTALPVEYQLLAQRPEPWESWHCLAAYKIRNSLLDTFESKLWRTRLAQVVGPENLAQLIKYVSLPAEVFTRALLALEPPDADCAQALNLLALATRRRRLSS